MNAPAPYHVGSVSADSADKTEMVFTIANRVGGLKECLDVLASHGVDLSKIESRPSRTSDEGYDFFVQFESSVADDVLEAIKKDLVEKQAAVSFLGGRSIASTPWYPKKISDLDQFAHKVLAYGTELDSDHPGFTDEVYRKRRLEITQIAKDYKHGDLIPRVDYSEEEVNTWRQVYTKLRALYATHACSQHNHIFPLLEKNCGYSPDNIPQLEDISRFLKSCTGWSLRPVTGLLSPRDFLNGLAFRVFHSTQYIRHHSKPFYTPEPDVCHELLGHVPLFADPDFAEFSQQIGLASLGVSDADIEKLASCYWFTVEFGLCKQVVDGKEEIRAFGAGLLSSFGELEYCLSDEPGKQPFDPFVAAVTPYPITKYQPQYFVAENFERAKNQLIEFSRSLSRPFELHYNPYSQSVTVLDSPDKISRVTRELMQELFAVTNALTRLQK